MGPSEQLGMIQMVTGGRNEADMDPDLLPSAPPVSQGAGSGPLWSWVPATKALLPLFVPAPEDWCPQTGHPACPPSRPQPGAAAFPPGRVTGISHIMARGLRVLCRAAPLASTR